jgi:hypothetical protein
MLEKKLLEEVQRFRSINKNANNLNEQELPGAPAPAPAAPEGDTALDATAPTPGPADAPVPDLDPSGDQAPVPADGAESDTEEIDVTELVNMTKNIKSDMEATKGEQDAVLQKMDDAFSKLSDLEGKLAQMDQVLIKIDELGSKVEAMKPETPVEKLEMRSLDSYPFNQKPNDFFTVKQQEMRQSGKNEYVLTKGDIESYSKDEIAKTFNPEEDEIEF